MDNRLNEKEWLLINDIIGKIYPIRDVKKFAETFLLLIRRLIPYKAAVFTILNSKYTVDENKMVVIDENDISIKEYNLKYAIEDFTNPILSYPKSVSYRDVDIINKEQKRKTELYRDWLLPRGFEYLGGLIIKKEDKFTTCFTFYRNELNGNLNDKELFILDIFIQHLENILSDLLLQKRREFFIYDNIRNYKALSNREKEVLPFILNGFSNQEMSEVFCISNSTVKKHIYSIFYKLSVNSRGELIKLFTASNDLIISRSSIEPED